MPKNKRLNIGPGLDGRSEESPSPASLRSRLSTLARNNVVLIAVILFISVGALGAGLKMLDDHAKQVMENRAKKGFMAPMEESSLNRLNPFLPTPTPPVPVLSKEIINAGGKIIVEDVGANPVAPADLAVWRPSTGYWWVMGGQQSQSLSTGWGTNGDTPLPGDYDGDGKTDLAVFRSSTNTWWVLKSSDATYYSLGFGSSGDAPAPADFDGDSRTDIAVYRPSEGKWYIQQSSNATTVVGQWGNSTDIPKPADFDGDGKADLAVWRASDTTYYSFNSSNSQPNYGAFTGLSSPTPIPGDYDGDGKADFAVRSGAYWVIKKSAANQTVSIPWQQAGDIAVQNDYDGDGKVDIAVWRESTGTWYIQNSADGSTRTVQWGTTGDIPVPAFFRR